MIRELAGDAAERGLAAHANRRKPGDAAPTSVYVGPILQAANMIVCTGLCLAFGFLAYHSIRLGEPVYSVWLLVASGALASWSLLGLWDGFVRRIDWDGVSVRFRKWNGEYVVAWENIVDVEDKSYPPHVRIAFSDGKGFAISETMNGSRHFRSLIERRLERRATGAPASSKRQRRRRHVKKK